MNSKLKKVLKRIGLAIGAFIAFILIYLIASFGLSRISIAEEEGQADEVSIFIVTNNVHTDIVVPIRNEQIDWSKEVKLSNIQSTDSTYQYLAMGWGDKGFYLETPTWAELKASVAFKAATGLSTTAIHTTYYKEMVESETCRKIEISKEQYQRLINYVNNSFQKDNDGHYINIKTNANYSKTDAFYEANGSYSMFHTCNTWANNCLKDCGQKACLWTPFDTGIFLNYE